MSEEDRPQAWALADLPLHRLISLGRKVKPKETRQGLKLAVLGDAATQHYCQALSAVFKLRGFWPDIYESEYDMLQQEIRDPASALYAHQSDFIVLFTTTQALWARYAGSADKAGFADQVMADIAEFWEILKERSEAIIVQHNFVVPINRPYGSNTNGSFDSFAAAITKLNMLLAEQAAPEGVKLVDSEFQASYHGKKDWLDERLWCQARQALSPAFLPSLVKCVSDTILMERGVGIKCVILDLDNTLWGGILADDGLERIEIGQAEMGLVFARFQMSLAELRARGVLLAACSKNDQENVLNVFDNHPDMVLRRDDFSIIVANFGDKVSNIMHIRETLNIGFDSMVFFDDTPFERDLVRSALPEIQVPELSEDPADFLEQIARWNLFEGRAATSEDLARNAYYQADSKRSDVRQKYEGLDDFITDLEMHAKILPIDGYTLPRALQLVQRSNQFNLTTIRHSEDTLKEFASSPDVSAFCIRLSDRLGDNGIIALVILRREDRRAIVDTWIMSCRVLGRKVEDVTVQQMVLAAQKMGCDEIIGQYIPSAKNGMVKNLYTEHGFEEMENDGTTHLFQLSADQYAPKPFPIKIQQEELVE